jgi:beta-xylosidase
LISLCSGLKKKLRGASRTKSRKPERLLLLLLWLIPAASVSGGGDRSPTALNPLERLAASTNVPGQSAWGDQGEGTYSNPVMPGDFSDLDAIRVGGDYYAISSTMQYSAGMAIVYSKDLVNWTMIGHVVPDLPLIDAELNWNKMNRPGRGIWAGAIRYHAKKFWVYFGTPDQGIFMSTAVVPTGPWTRARRVLAGAGWDDPCPFWDDDGQAYLVTTNFAPEGPSGRSYNIHLFRMNEGGTALLVKSDRIIHQSKGSEANKLYKIHGLYYHYYSEVRGEGRVPMMERSPSLDGPWESHQLMHVNAALDKEPNQGGLVEIPSGEWYFLTHQGRGAWEGRAGVLLPVTWIKGWPIIGKVGMDGIGNMIWRAKKPIPGFPRMTLSASDSFDEPVLKPEWEWNYQPRAGMWSLTEHPGALTMHAFPPIRPGDFRTIGDILTQRAFRTRQNEVTLKLDLSAMADGQEAGLTHFAKSYCTLGIVQKAKVRLLSYNQNGRRVTGPRISASTIYLRSVWGFAGKSQFFYSLDGRTYQPFGDAYQLTWGSYRGDRIGIFTDNSEAVAGSLYVDSFQYQVQH